MAMNLTWIWLLASRRAGESYIYRVTVLGYRGEEPEVRQVDNVALAYFAIWPLGVWANGTREENNFENNYASVLAYSILI
jgi:hypothetical protein